METKASFVESGRRSALKVLALSLVATTLAACGGGGGGGGGGGQTPPAPTAVYQADDRASGGSPQLYLAGSGENLTGSLAGGVGAFKVTADKRSVVFVGTPNGVSGGLRLWRVDVANPRRLVQLSRTPIAGGNVMQFEISPDGKQVVYAGDMEIDDVSEVYLVNLDGTDERKINGSVGSTVEVSLPVRGAWSRDGRYILQMVRNRDGTPAGLNEHDATLGTFNSTRITPTPWPAWSLSDATWLPDASGFVFLSNARGPQELMLMRRGVTNAITVLNDPLPTSGAVLDYMLAANGSGVFFRASSGTATRFEVFGVAMSSNQIARSAIRLGNAQTQGGGVAEFALSPDGSTIAYAADENGAGALQLFTASASASGPSTAASGPVTGTVADFAFTPDGRSLVYRSGVPSPVRTNSEFDLSIVNLAVPARPTRLNGAKVPAGSVYAGFRITDDSSAVIYRGDLLTNGLDELFYTRFASPGSSTRFNVPLASGTRVVDFDAR